jgi:hypothetical protein
MSVVDLYRRLVLIREEQELFEELKRLTGLFSYNRKQNLVNCQFGRLITILLAVLPIALAAGSLHEASAVHDGDLFAPAANFQCMHE